MEWLAADVIGQANQCEAMLFAPLVQRLHDGVLLIAMPSLKLTGTFEQSLEARVRAAFVEVLMNGFVSQSIAAASPALTHSKAASNSSRPTRAPMCAFGG